MTDVEQLVRDRYIAALGGMMPSADEATVAALLGSARSRRRNRTVLGGLSAIGVAAAIAVGTHALISSPLPPTGVPSVAPSASASPSMRSDVTYVTSLPGIVPVDPATLGTAVVSEIPGTPAFYPVSQAIVDQLGPGWGYAVFGNSRCAAGSPAGIAVVSPDGKAFRTDDLPVGVCGAIPTGASGHLLFLWTGSDMTDGPMYVANLATGSVTLVDPGLSPSMPEGLVTSGGTAILAMRGGDDVSVAISLDAEGRQTKVDLRVDPHDLMWGQSQGHLMFAKANQEPGPLKDWRWNAIAQGERAAKPVTIVGAPDSATHCDVQNASGPGGVIFNCDDDTYVMSWDGTVTKRAPLTDYGLKLETSFSELAVGDVGTLNARVAFPFGAGAATVLDPSALDPVSTGPWQRASEVTAIGTSISAEVGGVEAEYTQPSGDDFYGKVVALATRQGTMVVLPSTFDGVQTAADEWMWWQADR